MEQLGLGDGGFCNHLLLHIHWYYYIINNIIMTESTKIASLTLFLLLWNHRTIDSLYHRRFPIEAFGVILGSLRSGCRQNCHNHHHTIALPFCLCHEQLLKYGTNSRFVCRPQMMFHCIHLTHTHLIWRVYCGFLCQPIPPDLHQVQNHRIVACERWKFIVTSHGSNSLPDRHRYLWWLRIQHLLHPKL